MRYLEKSFSVAGDTDKYRDEYERIFGKKTTVKEQKNARLHKTSK